MHSERKTIILQREGFTLVEILVVLAVTGIITAGTFNFMVAQNRSYSLQENIQEMEQNARIALNILVKELYEADEVTIEDQGYAVKFMSDGSSSAYRHILRTGKPWDDKTSERINGTGTVGLIAAFITQDMKGDSLRDTPIFQYDDPADPKMVFLKIIARTRRPDPNYGLNNGYRQIILTRRVVLKNRG